ncbi:MAG: hypothetical protein ABJA98_28410 [Acidobacteriota bacterium]
MSFENVTRDTAVAAWKELFTAGDVPDARIHSQDAATHRVTKRHVAQRMFVFKQIK